MPILLILDSPLAHRSCNPYLCKHGTLITMPNFFFCCLRDVGLMWSLFILGHLYITMYMARLLIKIKHQQDMFYNEVALCV